MSGSWHSSCLIFPDYLCISLNRGSMILLLLLLLKLISNLSPRRYSLKRLPKSLHFRFTHHVDPHSILAVDSLHQVIYNHPPQIVCSNLSDYRRGQFLRFDHESAHISMKTARLEGNDDADLVGQVLILCFAHNNTTQRNRKVCVEQ